MAGKAGKASTPHCHVCDRQGGDPSSADSNLLSPACPAWTDAIWRRACSHTNPTVAFMALNTFFGRAWSSFWLAGTSLDLVQGPLLRALCNPDLLRTGVLGTWQA